MKKQNVQLWGVRSTAWERAPDAVWEGYLMISHLSFPFSLVLTLPLPLLSRTRHIYPVTSWSSCDTPHMLVAAPFCQWGLSITVNLQTREWISLFHRCNKIMLILPEIMKMKLPVDYRHVCYSQEWRKPSQIHLYMSYVLLLARV